MPYHGLLWRVDQRDTPQGSVDFHLAHKEGILHRAINVVPFRDPGRKTVLLTLRGDIGGEGLWQLGGIDHVGHGLCWQGAALQCMNEQPLYSQQRDPVAFEIGDPLFHSSPRGSHRDNRSNCEIVRPACCTLTYEPTLHPECLRRYEWISLDQLLKDIASEPAKYTHTCRLVARKLATARLS